MPHIETLMASGRPGDPTSGRVSFADYVNQRWYPHHVLEPTTHESYRYSLDRHIIGWFGSMKMADILPIHVREWVTELSSAGVSPANIRHLKIILSAVFNTALNDFVIVLHPCRGVKTPTVAVHEYRILTPAEVTTLLAALPSDTAQLLVEVAIGSGLRWGELTELRPTDLHAASGIVTIIRVVTEVNPSAVTTGYVPAVVVCTREVTLPLGDLNSSTSSESQAGQALPRIYRPCRATRSDRCCKTGARGPDPYPGHEDQANFSRP